MPRKGALAGSSCASPTPRRSPIKQSATSLAEAMPASGTRGWGHVELASL